MKSQIFALVLLVGLVLSCKDEQPDNPLPDMSCSFETDWDSTMLMNELVGTWQSRYALISDPTTPITLEGSKQLIFKADGTMEIWENNVLSQSGTVTIEILEDGRIDIGASPNDGLLFYEETICNGFLRTGGADLDAVSYYFEKQ